LAILSIPSSWHTRRSPHHTPPHPAPPHSTPPHPAPPHPTTTPHHTTPHHTLSPTPVPSKHLARWQSVETRRAHSLAYSHAVSSVARSCPGTCLTWQPGWGTDGAGWCAGGGGALVSRPPIGFEAGSRLRLIDSCITQLKAQGPSRTCNESKEEEKKKASHWLGTAGSCEQACFKVEGAGLCSWHGRVGRCG